MPIKLYIPKPQTNKPNSKLVSHPSPANPITESSPTIPSYKNAQTTNLPATEAITKPPIPTPTYREYKRTTITPTYTQEGSQKAQYIPTQPHSLHFFKQNAWSGKFKDEFPFPLNRITPSKILNNIETLSADSSADRK